MTNGFSAATRGLADATALRHPQRHVCGWAGRGNSGANHDALNPHGMHGGDPRGKFVAAARLLPGLFEIIDTSQRGTAVHLTLAQVRNSRAGVPKSVRTPSCVDSAAADTARRDHAATPCTQEAERWACLVDVRGAGYSGRVPALLHTGRPLLYHDRPGLRTYFEHPSFVAPIRPWTHYVPVAANLSDLAENAHWMLNQSNAAAAAAIGRRGLAYARCYLTVDFAQEFAVEQLLAAAQRNADAGAVDPDCTEFYGPPHHRRPPSHSDRPHNNHSHSSHATVAA